MRLKPAEKVVEEEHFENEKKLNRMMKFLKKQLKIQKN